MKTLIKKFNHPTILASIFLIVLLAASCKNSDKRIPVSGVELNEVQAEAPEYFLLRPEVEKAYGYSHAVKIGNDLKISGAVSMDDKGNLTAAGSMDQQMKNCYSDLEKILKHYGFTFDDVVVENVFTTNMAEFINVSAFRNSIYTKQFPTGTWLEVKGLALPGQLIEIDMEAHKSE
jgi:enamine deaminase RidA (YjgF/YER057c/UK114 family)